MISRYNRSQFIIAFFAIIGGLFCSWLGFLFFRYIPAFALDGFGFEVSITTARLIGWGGLIVLFISGYSVWKKGGGLTPYGESALYFEPIGRAETGGTYLVNRELGQVTGTSHALSQLFLAGPLLLFNAATRLVNLVPQSSQLEGRMKEVLEQARIANKWQRMDEYPGREEEIRYLTQVGAVDFAVSKEIPKFKVNSDYGN